MEDKKGLQSMRHNSLCSKRGANWVRVGTAKHLWIDWMDSWFVSNMAI